VTGSPNMDVQPVTTPSGVSPAPASVSKTPHDKEVNEVSFTAYPKLMFIWPIILAGLVFWPLAWESALPVLGWTYLLIWVFVVLTLGVDVGRDQAVFWVVLLLLIGAGGALVNAWWQIPVLTNIYGFFGSLGVKYDRGFGLGMSVVLAIPFVIMIFWSRFNDRWRITHNEFEHYRFGRTTESLGRGAKTIRIEYPDVFEAVLGLAGTLIVYSATGRQELRRIPHVLFLPYVRAKLNKVLETMAVTGLAQAAAEEEEG